MFPDEFEKIPIYPVALRPVPALKLIDPMTAFSHVEIADSGFFQEFLHLFV